jgi:L-ascorbate metabolism protein UlaG (beta-lactamase superfamily)
MNYKGIDIVWKGHAGFMIKAGGKIIYIDPFELDFVSEEEKADYVLITHSHYDHCSVEDIKKVVKPETMILCPADVQSKMRHVGEIELQIVEPGKSVDLIEGLSVDAVSAYNIDKEFHTKEEYWVGYIVDFKGTRVYHAGDSDMIPEMQNIAANVVLLPVGGTYTMDSEQAANAVALISPDLAIPMHWGGGVIGDRDDAEDFLEKCRTKGIEAKILEKGE